MPRTCATAVPLPIITIPFRRGSVRDPGDDFCHGVNYPYFLSLTIKLSAGLDFLFMGNSLFYTICRFKLYIDKRIRWKMHLYDIPYRDKSSRDVTICLP